MLCVSDMAVPANPYSYPQFTQAGNIQRCHPARQERGPASLVQALSCPESPCSRQIQKGWFGETQAHYEQLRPAAPRMCLSTVERHSHGSLHSLMPCELRIRTQEFRCPKMQVGVPWWLSGKESTCHAEDVGSIPGSGKSPGEGNGNPLQYSCLEDPMDRGAWWATVHGVTKSWTRLSN